jgi:hypothetical protein
MFAALSPRAHGEDSHGSGATPPNYSSRPVAEDPTPVPVGDALSETVASNARSVSGEGAQTIDSATTDMRRLSRGESGAIQACWEQHPVGEWYGALPEVIPASFTNIR